MPLNKKNVLFVVLLVLIVGLVLTITSVKRETPTSHISLGSVLILSGDFKSYGEQFRDGAQLAVDEINEKSQSDETAVEVTFYDSEANKALAVEKLKALKERDKINFVIEIMGSGIALHTVPYITQNRMLVFSGVNTSPDLTLQGGPYFYRIIPSDGVASQQIARWALDLGNSKGAIVYATDSWGTGLKTVLEKTYEQLGGEFVSIRDSELKQNIFQPIVSALKATSPDVVFLILYPREAALFLKEAKKQGFKTNFMGTDNFTGSELVEVGGDAVEGARFVIPGTEEKLSGAKRRFLELYHRDYGPEKEPALFTIMGYDCVHLAVRVIRESNGKVEKAREILSAIRFEGVSGPIAFDENNDVKVQNYTKKIYVYDKVNNTCKAVDVAK